MLPGEAAHTILAGNVLDCAVNEGGQLQAVQPCRACAGESGGAMAAARASLLCCDSPPCVHLGRPSGSATSREARSSGLKALRQQRHGGGRSTRGAVAAEAAAAAAAAAHLNDVGAPLGRVGRQALWIQQPLRLHSGGRQGDEGKQQHGAHCFWTGGMPGLAPAGLDERRSLLVIDCKPVGCPVVSSCLQTAAPAAHGVPHSLLIKGCCRPVALTAHCSLRGLHG